MESNNRDLSVGSESRPTPGNEQLDTMETNGARAVSVSSVRHTSESGVNKVLLLLKPADPFCHVQVATSNIYYLTNTILTFPSRSLPVSTRSSANWKRG